MQSHEQTFTGKNILITGGLGFIGSNLAIRLAELNPAKIVIVDSLVEGLGGDLQNISEIREMGNVEIFYGKEWDIRNIEKMKPRIKEADFIFNLAGSGKHTGLDEKDLEFDTNVNFISQVLFLEACRQVMIESPEKKLGMVFAGTRDQYGKVPQQDLPVKENYLPKKMTDYQSISKNAIEAHHLVLHNVLKEQGIEGVKISSIRITNTYGPRQSSKASAVIPVFIEKCLAGETIELWGGGCVLRDLNYVDDVVNAFLLVGGSEKTGGEIYNLGCCIGALGMQNAIGGNLVTIKQLAERIVGVVGRGEIKVIPYPGDRKAVEPGHFAADILKISELGWAPKVGLEDGIRKSVGFLLKISGK